MSAGCGTTVATRGLETRPLSAEALAAGVLSDEVVELGAGTSAAKRPDHPVRLVQVAVTPSTPRGKRRGGKTGPPSDGVLRLATNLLDVPAQIIAEIYRQRWTIELFFRFFKHVLGCRHLLSTSRAGVEIQTYCAIIACLLLALWTGGKPTLRTYEMVCLYWQGWASEEELLAHLAKAEAASRVRPAVAPRCRLAARLRAMETPRLPTPTLPRAPPDAAPGETGPDAMISNSNPRAEQEWDSSI